MLDNYPASVTVAQNYKRAWMYCVRKQMNKCVFREISPPRREGAQRVSRIRALPLVCLLRVWGSTQGNLFFLWTRCRFPKRQQLSAIPGCPLNLLLFLVKLKRRSISLPPLQLGSVICHLLALEVPSSLLFCVRILGTQFVWSGIVMQWESQAPITQSSARRLAFQTGIPKSPN